MWESFVNNTDVQPRIDERNATNLGELNESKNISNLTYTKNTIPSHRRMAIACLNINSLIAHIDEIKKPRSKSVLVSTWYRPPDSPMSQFIEFEKMIGSFDAENLEYFLLGDLNVDLISTTASPIKNKLKEILDIYN